MDVADPAAELRRVLHQPALKRLAWDDLKMLKEELDG